jgi:hypothetical protein
MYPMRQYWKFEEGEVRDPAKVGENTIARNLYSIVRRKNLLERSSEL